MAIFRPKNWVFGQQNEICGQNATRDLFLYHQMGAACKIWANSIGSFPRSGVDWKKRLKLIFEKGLGLGALPRPRKLRWTVGADHLEWERGGGIMFLAIFSTKGGRPRPPTVVERGPKSFHTWWFFDMFSYIDQILGVAWRRQPLQNTKSYSQPCWGSCGTASSVLKLSGARRCALFEKCFLDRLFQMARGASWNNPICT